MALGCRTEEVEKLRLVLHIRCYDGALSLFSKKKKTKKVFQTGNQVSGLTGKVRGRNGESQEGGESDE